MNKELYIGVMSGTSLDGVDIALCAIDKNSCDLLASYGHHFPKSLRAEILHTIASEVTLKQIGELDRKLGEMFAGAVNLLIDKEDIDIRSVAAIGLHGQTLWHQPEGEHPFSMQLGDPNIVAARTGMKVVADFRRKDMAFGGSGAPYAPAFHRFIFKNRSSDSEMIIANIGGIANITVLGKDLTGYDTGPGNMLMDAWIARYHNKTYDMDGAWAEKGKVLYPLLERMMKDEYFSRGYPKSTGREKFNLEWVENIQRSVFGVQEELKPEDIQRTLLELTAQSLSNEILKFNPDMLLLCGGGAKNNLLVERLSSLMPNIHVGIIDNAEMLEAMMMAWLAYKRLHNEYVDLKEVTGASQNTVLGALYA